MLTAAMILTMLSQASDRSCIIDPLEVIGVHWGMSAAELQQARPDAVDEGLSRMHIWSEPARPFIGEEGEIKYTFGDFRNETPDGLSRISLEFDLGRGMCSMLSDHYRQWFEFNCGVEFSETAFEVGYSIWGWIEDGTMVRIGFPYEQDSCQFRVSMNALSRNSYTYREDGLLRGH